MCNYVCNTFRLPGYHFNARTLFPISPLHTIPVTVNFRRYKILTRFPKTTRLSLQSYELLLLAEVHEKAQQSSHSVWCLGAWSLSVSKVSRLHRVSRELLWFHTARAPLWRRFTEQILIIPLGFSPWLPLASVSCISFSDNHKHSFNVGLNSNIKHYHNGVSLTRKVYWLSYS